MSDLRELVFKWVLDKNPYAVLLMQAEIKDSLPGQWGHVTTRDLADILPAKGYTNYADEIIAAIGEPTLCWSETIIEDWVKEPQPRTVKQIAETAKLIRIEDPEPEPDKPSVVGWVIFAIVVGAVVALCAM